MRRGVITTDEIKNHLKEMSIKEAAHKLSLNNGVPLNIVEERITIYLKYADNKFTDQ